MKLAPEAQEIMWIFGLAMVAICILPVADIVLSILCHCNPQ